MALPTERNISVLQGTDNYLEFTIKDENDTAIDITNDSITFIATESFGGPVKIPLKTNSSGSHSDPTNGKTKFKIEDTEIDDEVSTAVDTVLRYEVRRIENGTNDEFVHYNGKLTVKPSIS